MNVEWLVSQAMVKHDHKIQLFGNIPHGDLKRYLTYKYFIWRLTERIFKLKILCILFDLIKTRGRKVGGVKKSCLQIVQSLWNLSLLLVMQRFLIFVSEKQKIQKVKFDIKKWSLRCGLLVYQWYAFHNRFAFP